MSKRRLSDKAERVNPVHPVHVWKSPPGAAVDMVIVTKLETYFVIHEHSMRALPAETGGFLVGTVGYDSWIGCWHVQIEEAIPLEPMEQNPTYFSFTWRDVDQVRNYREAEGKALIGWYHTHPDLGIFLSETDLERTHRVLFAEPFQIALVYDPVRGRAGYFFWEGPQQIDAREADWREFEIEVEGDVIGSHEYSGVAEISAGEDRAEPEVYGFFPGIETSAGDRSGESLPSTNEHPRNGKQGPPETVEGVLMIVDPDLTEEAPDYPSSEETASDRMEAEDWDAYGTTDTAEAGPGDWGVEPEVGQIYPSKQVAAQESVEQSGATGVEEELDATRELEASPELETVAEEETGTPVTGYRPGVSPRPPDDPRGFWARFRPPSSGRDQSRRPVVPANEEESEEQALEDRVEDRGSGRESK